MRRVSLHVAGRSRRSTPASWNFILSTVRSEVTNVPGLPWPVEVKPMVNSKSMRLRVDEGRGRLVLTHPRRMSRRAALRWAEGQADWARRQVEAMAPAIPFAPGSIIPIEGQVCRIAWDDRHPRTPTRRQGELRCGGPIESLPGRVERYLRALARDRLSERTATLARLAGVTVKSVSVGDPRSRWGSCSASGSIRYNWRLIMAPPDVLEWVVAHEVAHRRHMNHGPDFHALESKLFGRDVNRARREMRALGPRLKRIGRAI